MLLSINNQFAYSDFPKLTPQTTDKLESIILLLNILLRLNAIISPNGTNLKQSFLKMPTCAFYQKNACITFVLIISYLTLSLVLVILSA